MSYEPTITTSSFASRSLVTSLLVLVCCALPMRSFAQARPIKVCATVPELGSLVREIGGDQVSVTVFAKATEDPHFIEAKPSFVKATSEADLFVFGGLEMEVGYVPVLLTNSRNAAVLTGSRGYVDCSKVIQPLEVPSGTIDRSLGDVHAAGNPHYLLDPLNGLKVAALLRDTLADQRPEKREYFAARYADFRMRLGVALVGPRLFNKYDKEFEKLAALAEYGRLAPFLKSQGEENMMGGWLGAATPYFGTKYVDEHDLWIYFARRFGLRNVGHMEPVPGVPPTTKHLGELIGRMKQDQVGLIISVPYYDPKHAEFVARQTGAKVARLAHQVGAIQGADDYISMFDADIRALTSALGGGR